MSKRQKQTAFLRALILHGNAEERARLQERISRAERDEQCAWRALWLVSLLAVFSCLGICYSAVLIPEFFNQSSHPIVKVFCGLGLASLICATAFLGFWIWCRGVMNRVQEDCRRFVMAMMEPRPRTQEDTDAGGPPARPDDRIVSLNATRFPEGSPAELPACRTYSQLFSLRRAS